MKLTIIPSKQIVTKNGVTLSCSFEMPPEIHAIQWDGTKGEIEYIDKRLPNTKIKNVSEIENLGGVLLAYKEAKQKKKPSLYHTWNEEIEEWEITKENESQKKADEKEYKDKQKSNVFYGVSGDEAGQIIENAPNSVQACKNLMKDIVRLIKT